jgi:hypothetical protein
MPETEIVEIHPASYFTSNHAYIGHKTAGLTPIHSLIRDDRKIILCEVADLAREKLVLKHYRSTRYPQWSQTNINNFKDGTIQPPEPAALFQEIKQFFINNIEFSNEHYYNYITLWTIGIYFYQLFNTYPYVYLNGPAQSGKTKLLTLCSVLSPNGQLSLHMNPAGVFRMVEGSNCPLFIDEREELSVRARSSEFRTMLLGGYKKGSTVQRMVRDEDGNFDPEEYAVYSPKMLANINGIDNVLESRCITIIMERGADAEKTNREVTIDDPAWQQTRDKLFLFLMCHWRAIRQAYVGTTNVAKVTGRDWELWKPIFALAKFFGNDLLDEMKALAVTNAEQRRIDNAEEHENILIETLLDLVTKTGYYKISDVKDSFASYFENSNFLTEQYVGTLLRRFGFTNKKRMNHGYVYFISVEKVKQLAQRAGIGTDSEGSEGSVSILEGEVEITSL